MASLSAVGVGRARLCFVRAGTADFLSISIGHAIKTRAQHQGAAGFTVFFQFIFAGHGFAARVENFAMHQPPLPPAG